MGLRKWWRCRPLRRRPPPTSPPVLLIPEALPSIGLETVEREEEMVRERQLRLKRLTDEAAVIGRERP